MFTKNFAKSYPLTLSLFLKTLYLAKRRDIDFVTSTKTHDKTDKNGLKTVKIQKSFTTVEKRE